MKVKDLIRSLMRADQELDVYAAPAIYVKDGNREAGDPDEYVKTPDLNKRFKVEKVGEMSNFMRDEDPTPYLVLMYDDQWDDDSPVLTDEDK